MDSTKQAEFKRLFDKYFLQCTQSGYSKSESAARALVSANAFLQSKKSGSNIDSDGILGDGLLMLDVGVDAFSSSLKMNIDIVSVNSAISEGVDSVERLVRSTFSSISAISNSFFDTKGTNEISKDALDSSPIDFDVEHASSVFFLLLGLNERTVSDTIVDSLRILGNEMAKKASNFDQTKSLKGLLFVLEHPQLMDPRFEGILKSVFAAVEVLNMALKRALTAWFATHAGPHRLARCVAVCRQHITLQIYQADQEDEHGQGNEQLDCARSGCRFLSLLYIASRSRGAAVASALAPSDFYVDALNEDYMVSEEGRRREFLLWLRETDRRQQHAMGAVSERYLTHSRRWKSFISFPFVLSPGIKALVLELDAAVQQRRGMDAEIRTAVFTGQRFVVPYFVLRVSRDRIVADALTQILLFEDSEFKKPLKVVFDDEDGVDAGGVRKEFYQIVTRQLFDPTYGMFKYYDESRLLWFNSDSLETDREFELIGILLGVAIYNSIIIDLRMPLAVYKKLLRGSGKQQGQPQRVTESTLDDLAALQPSLAKGLKALLDFEGDVQNAFGASFQLSYELFGEMISVDLKPDGGNVPVTNDNRQEYVDLYVHYIMDKSVQQQFAAFERGFRKVCGGPALNLFEAQELELLVCGSRTLDFEELKSGAEYTDGYDEHSQAISQLWDILLNDFDDTERRAFLKFVSGSDRSPIDGLSKLRLCVSRNGSEDSRLPSAHTCFNHMLLPEYSSIDVMRERIRYAITQTEGFGLI